MENKYMKKSSTSLAAEKCSGNIGLGVSPVIGRLRSYRPLIAARRRGVKSLQWHFPGKSPLSGIVGKHKLDLMGEEKKKRQSWVGLGDGGEESGNGKS